MKALPHHGRSRAKVETLKSRAEFQRIRGGSKWGTRGFMLEAKARPDPTPANGEAATPRFGLTITKKIGIAVERNRIRRRLKAAIRELQCRHARPGYDYVLIARRAALDCTYPDLVKDLEIALKRVGSEPRATRS
jgi:ribonuclease P protein component